MSSMRTALLAAVLGVATLAGCFSMADSDPQSPDVDRPANETPDDEERASGEAARVNRSMVSSPDPPTNRRWTYEASGAWNDLGRFDVVLSEIPDGGYLLAGATPDDLDEEVVHDRPWHGPVNERLNPVEDSWGPLFDFPLHDGKTWAWDDGETVHANARSLETPSTPSDGFEMVLKGREGVELRWTYAPSVAFLTSLTYELGNTTVLDIELVDVGASQDSIWFEPGPSDFANGDREPDEPGVSRFEVPEGYDSVVVAAGAKGGGKVTVHPPPTSRIEPWTFEGGQAEQWTYDPLPGDEGDWTLHASRDPSQLESGYVGVSAAAVKWLEPGT